jgi:hypothetical protein
MDCLLSNDNHPVFHLVGEGSYLVALASKILENGTQEVSVWSLGEAIPTLDLIDELIATSLAPELVPVPLVALDYYEAKLYAIGALGVGALSSSTMPATLAGKHRLYLFMGIIVTAGTARVVFGAVASEVVLEASALFATGGGLTHSRLESLYGSIFARSKHNKNLLSFARLAGSCVCVCPIGTLTLAVCLAF